MNVEATPRNTMLDAFAALLDSGNIQFRTAADNLVAECTFGATAFGAAAAGAITANAITEEDDTTAGTVDYAELRKSDDTLLATLTVTATGGGGDVELTSLVYADGETLTIDSMVITLPAT